MDRRDRVPFPREGAVGHGPQGRVSGQGTFLMAPHSCARVVSASSGRRGSQALRGGEVGGEYLSGTEKAPTGNGFTEWGHGPEARGVTAWAGQWGGRPATEPRGAAPTVAAGVPVLPQVTLTARPTQGRWRRAPRLPSAEASLSGSCRGVGARGSVGSSSCSLGTSPRAARGGGTEQAPAWERPSLAPVSPTITPGRAPVPVPSTPT